MPNLYHYTNAAGLEGILTSRTLRLSDFRFLNDPGEIRYGAKLVDEYMEKSTNLPNFHGEKVSDDFHRDLSIGQDGKSVFVGSLSGHGDLLSQWRGYNRGLGFSIGFDSDAIGSLFDASFDNKNDLMQPVVYEEAEQQGIIASLFRKFPQNLDGHFMRSYGGWRTDLIRAVISFKDKGFAEEKETRIIAIGEMTRDEVKVTASAKGLRPYWERSLCTRHDRAAVDFPLRKIFVGPGLPPAQVDAVEILLKNLGLKCEVKPSSIPYIAD